jgi:hypothetical protein
MVVQAVGALFKARIVRGINSAPTNVSISVGALLKRDGVSRRCIADEQIN